MDPQTIPNLSEAPVDEKEDHEYLIEESTSVRVPRYAQRLQAPSLHQVCVKCRSYIGSVRAATSGKLVRCPVCGVVNPVTGSIAKPHQSHQLFAQAVQWSSEQTSTFLQKLPTIPLGSVIKHQLNGKQLLTMNQAEMLQLYQMD